MIFIRLHRSTKGNAISGGSMFCSVRQILTIIGSRLQNDVENLQ